MNAKMKRRLFAATGAIVIVVAVVLAVVGSNSAARTVSVAEAASLSDSSKKIQVTGNVVENSFTIEDDTLTFLIYDPDSDGGAAQLPVRYEGGVSATFGNEVTAICTGKMAPDGTLACSELVTKCPAKYEDATSALDVAALLGYGDEVVNKPVKVAGSVKAGTLGGIDQDARFVLVDLESAQELAVAFAGALPDELAEGEPVVLTGSIGSDGVFTATAISLEA